MTRSFHHPAPVTAALVALVALAACAEPEGAGAAPDDAPSPGTAAFVSNESETEVTPALPGSGAEPDTTLPPTVTVAGQTVPRRAYVTAVEAGDRACYLTLRTDDGGATTVYGDFSLCESDGLMNRRIQIEYAPETILAASCDGDPECLETEMVAMAVAADRIAGTAAAPSTAE